MTQVKFENNVNSPLCKEILEKTKKDLGFVPNLYLEMAHNPATLDAYTYAYHSFRVHAGFTPAEQEVIFLSAAYENNCEYCMSAHSFVADHMSKVPQDVTHAIREGKEISDPKFNALSRLTRLLTANRGIVEQKEIDNFLTAGYPAEAILGIIVGISVKTMSNYVSHVTNPAVDQPFQGRKWTKRNQK